MKKTCLSMDNLIHEALGLKVEESGSWAVEKIHAGVSVDTVMAVGSFLNRHSEVERASQMLTSDVFRETVVVPDSRQLDDGSFTANILHPRKIFRSEYERLLINMGLMDVR